MVHVLYSPHVKKSIPPPRVATQTTYPLLFHLVSLSPPCLREITEHHRCILSSPKPTMPSPPTVRLVPLRPLPQQYCQDASPPPPLTMAVGRRCQGASGHLQPCQGAPTSAAGVGGAKMSAAPTLTAGIDRPRSLPPMLQKFDSIVADVSEARCKCFV